MNVVHDVTQKLGAEISKEDTSKVAVNFGEAGRQLGSLFARYQYENSQKEFSQGMPAMPNLNLNLSTPDLSNIQTAKDVEDMSFQYAQKLEEATRAKASGSISDAEFNKRVSDADSWAYSKGMNLAGMKKARDSVVGFNDVNKNIAVGTYMSMQQGKNKAVEEGEKDNTERWLKKGQEKTGRSDLPRDLLIQIGEQIERAENNLLNNPKVRAELEKIGISKEEIERIDTVTVLDYFGPLIEEAAFRLRDLDPVQRYTALRRFVTDKTVSLGINLTPSQQETINTRLSSYKNASKEALESRKNENDHMSEDQRRAKLNYYASLPPNIKEAFYMAEMAGFKLAEFDPKMTEAILNYMKDGTKSPPMDAKTQENLYRMALQNPRGSSQLPAEAQNNTNKFVNKKTLENNTRTDSESVEANNKNTPTIFNYYAGVDTSKLTSEDKEESKQAIKSVVKQVALKVSQELDNRFSIGVSPSGLYVALYDGKPYKASATGEFFGTDGALLIQTVSKMNEAYAAYDNFQVSNKERLEAISDVVFSGKTTGEIASAPLHLSNAVVGAVLDIGVAGNKLLGLDPDPKAAAEGKRVLNKSAEAFARGVDELTGSTGPQQHKMLEPEMTKITEQDINAAIRKVRGGSTEVFDESDRPAEGLTDTGETSPEVMTAALEVKPTEGSLTVNYKALDGEYTGTVTTGGNIPPNTTVWTHRRARKKALSQESIDKAKADFSPVVDEVVDQMDAGETTVTVPTLSDGKKVNVTTAPDLALIVLGEGFTESKSKSNTIGFGTKVEAAKPILKEMGITYSDDTKITHEQGLELAHRYLKKDIDSKIKSVIGEEAFNMLDPIRLMVARDVLYAYGRSSVNWTGYKQVGLDKYLLNTLDESKPVSEILKYKPTFPPFVGKRNGARQVFYAPYGASRMGLVEAFLDNIE